MNPPCVSRSRISARGSAARLGNAYRYLDKALVVQGISVGRWRQLEHAATAAGPAPVHATKLQMNSTPAADSCDAVEGARGDRAPASTTSSAATMLAETTHQAWRHVAPEPEPPPLHPGYPPLPPPGDAPPIDPFSDFAAISLSLPASCARGAL